jgi:protein prenyltransferase alpha subunit repeat containing protein 1
MSRALDSSQVSELRETTNSQAIYIDLVNALTPKDGLLEIEILGKSHPVPEGKTVLIDGNNIAVPKLKLVQAFVVARQTLFECLQNFQEHFQEIRDATAIILLMDPEHITAASSRKRVIYRACTLSSLERKDLMKTELRFVDSFLTSRLHRHTKSPTLWSHRRWLLKMFKFVNLPLEPQQYLQEVVLVAAERHSRNYYAWLHMRWLISNLHGSNDNAQILITACAAHIEITGTVKSWCLRHPTDTSGWSFLLFCLFYVRPPQNAIECLYWNDERASICSLILKMTARFQWTYESVWVFLRTVVCYPPITESFEQLRINFFVTLDGLLNTNLEKHIRVQLEDARRWVVDHREETTG